MTVRKRRLREKLAKHLYAEMYAAQFPVAIMSPEENWALMKVTTKDTWLKRADDIIAIIEEDHASSRR